MLFYFSNLLNLQNVMLFWFQPQLKLNFTSKNEVYDLGACVLINQTFGSPNLIGPQHDAVLLFDSNFTSVSSFGIHADDTWRKH